jgi:hypothetical protein
LVLRHLGDDFLDVERLAVLARHLRVVGLRHICIKTKTIRKKSKFSLLGRLDIAEDVVEDDYKKAFYGIHYEHVV